ncbi:MAG: hypothetical protein PHG85_02185 [Candidatus Altiarchaeota archaeon]|nr:hypothetical protein [Candidatus Altiarchaeota archaeon]
MIYLSSSGNLEETLVKIKERINFPDGSTEYSKDSFSKGYYEFKYQNRTVYLYQNLREIKDIRGKKYPYRISVTGFSSEDSRLDSTQVENLIREKFQKEILKAIDYEDYNTSYFHEVGKMGKILFEEVNRQLIDDLREYGINEKGVYVDWTNPCQEGHCTSFLGGDLENYSIVYVINTDGQIIANGWMDFIHGGGDNPLFVFWDYLHLYKNGERVDVKSKPGIPKHIWEKLPEKTKRLLTKKGEYDSMWHNDPLVQKYVENE